ncbi:MAG: 23S rRNA (adenine2503-C2)-methyltransferase [Verrucomicrobiales bacterium]|jgi:23S rRNA (adenine2503-C2)-methyltransferase
MPEETITGLTLTDLETRFEKWGEKKFRAKQLLEWVFAKRASSFDEMTNLSAELREKLAAEFQMRSMTLKTTQGSADTTQKFLFRLHDGRYVESVLIPANPSLYSETSDRRTLCVSSQVGCAFDCKFCASGLAGFARNLSAAEIVEQVLQAEEISGRRVDNIVFMGMGEPLANYPNLMKSIEILNSHWGVGIGARKMTVSTSGLAPQIRKFADHPLQIRLAISLHGASDEVRERIMPVNKRYPLDELFDSLRYFTERKKQKITFEYILIEGVNDDLGQAELLARRASSMRAKVNLIPYNTVDGLEWQRPSEERQDQFAAIVKKAGVMVTLRREKGHDIDAACGQLRLKEELGGEIADAVA